MAQKLSHAMKRSSAFRGGCRQRTQQAEGAAASSGDGNAFVGVVKTKVSRLAAGLVNAFVWGYRTGIDVKRTAVWAREDGLDHPDVIRLSKLKDDHAHGELLNMLAPTPYLECVLHVDMRFKKKHRFGSTVHSQDIILPHALFATMYHQQHDAWIERWVGGNVKHVEDFWEAMEGNPQLEDNDDLKDRSDYRTKCIPLTIHGDGLSIVGVKKSWQKCADVFSCAPLLGKGYGHLESLSATQL